MMSKSLSFNRTRIAPTPSGFLHLGNVLSFVITVAWARRTGARVLLRIDDLDRERYQPAYVQDIFDTLNFLELPWDEGPRNIGEFEREYSQVHRVSLYQEALGALAQEDRVFACTCSRSALQNRVVYPGTCRDKHNSLDMDEVNWRLHTSGPPVDGSQLPVNRGVTIKTLRADTFTTMLPASMRDFVVRKKNGFPAYQLSSVIDDLHFGVDLIVRGADLWPSTIAQLYLAGQLPANNFAATSFFHHSLLSGADGSKLSKSAGDTSIQFLRKEGYSCKAVFSLLGTMLGIGEPVDHWHSLADRLPNLLATEDVKSQA